MTQTETKGWRVKETPTALGIFRDIVQQEQFNGQDVLVNLRSAENAPLVAAAPDLLAACEAILKADEYANSVGVTLDDHMNRSERRKLLSAAIAKATNG